MSDLGGLGSRKGAEKVAKMKSMVFIAPGLYLGNKQATADPEALQRAGVTAVCSVGAKARAALPWHHVPIEDDGKSSMLPWLREACDFVTEHRRTGAAARNEKRIKTLENDDNDNKNTHSYIHSKKHAIYISRLWNLGPSQ